MSVRYAKVMPNHFRFGPAPSNGGLAVADAKQIIALCQDSQFEYLAPYFIAADVSLEDVRTRLAELATLPALIRDAGLSARESEILDLAAEAWKNPGAGIVPLLKIILEERPAKIDPNMSAYRRRVAALSARRPRKSS